MASMELPGGKGDSMLCYEKKKNALTVRLSGELDHSAATGIRRELDALIDQTGVKRLVFDLKGLEFMDSSASVLWCPSAFKRAAGRRRPATGFACSCVRPYPPPARSAHPHRP